MKRPLLLALIALLAAGSASAEVFRCEDPDGRLRFVDVSHACGGAVHPLKGRLERVGPVAPPAAAASSAPAHPPLVALLLSEAEAGDGWEVVREVPGRPADDPDLVRWGVRAQQARHYTRDLAGTAEVCSIELWSFASLEQATAARAGFSYPEWQIGREGEILMMVRGLRSPRRGAPERGVFAACEALGQRVRARCAEHVKPR